MTPTHLAASPNVPTCALAAWRLALGSTRPVKGTAPRVRSASGPTKDALLPASCLTPPRAPYYLRPPHPQSAKVVISTMPYLRYPSGRRQAAGAQEGSLLCKG